MHRSVKQTTQRNTQKVDVPTDSGMYATNHLIFVDDLNLMAESDEELKMLIKETKKFYKAI
jgi:hypothetical protein